MVSCRLPATAGNKPADGPSDGGSNCTRVPRAIFMYKPRLAFDAYPQYSDSSPNTRKAQTFVTNGDSGRKLPCKRPRNYGGTPTNPEPTTPPTPPAAKTARFAKPLTSSPFATVAQQTA